MIVTETTPRILTQEDIEFLGGNPKTQEYMATYLIWRYEMSYSDAGCSDDMFMRVLGHYLN